MTVPSTCSYLFESFHDRDVTKISSRSGIKQLGISFGLIFLLFSYESSPGAMFILVAGGNPQLRALNDSPT